MAVDSNLGAVVGAEKVRLFQSQVMKQELPKQMCEEVVSSQCTSGTQKAALRGMKPCWKQSRSRQEQPDDRG